MTKKERVIAAIEQREIDGVPSSFSLHFPADKKQGEACVKAHLDFFRDTDADICKIMNENLVPVFGTIHTPDDYDRLIPVMTMEDEFMKKQMELTRQILAGCDKDVFTMGTLHGICASGIHPIEQLASIIMQQDRCRLISSDGMRRRCLPLCSALPMCCACWQRLTSRLVWILFIMHPLAANMSSLRTKSSQSGSNRLISRVMKAIKRGRRILLPAHL